MAQPLAGIRVLELATGIEGPYASKMLADFGADVIKAEPPDGDPTRSYRAGSAEDADGVDRERSPLFLHLNTNKRSIVIDPSTPAGADRVRRIAAVADVVIESFRPGDMERWGLGHAALQSLNPALVTVSVTPFGQTGPYALYKGEELVLFGMGGVLNANGAADREPVKLGGEIGRYQCGNTAAMSTLAAVMLARQSGFGAHVDVANLETQAGSMDRRMTYLLYRAYTGRNAPREQRGSMRALPNGFFPTEDGYVLLATMPAWLPRMLATIEDPDLTARYRNPGFMMDEELPAIAETAMYEYTLARTAQGAMEEAQANGWPITALKAPVHVLEDEHWLDRAFFVDVDHPVAGTVRQPGAPIRMTDGWMLRRPAPTLGQHDGEVDDELDALAPPSGARPTPGVRPAPVSPEPVMLPLDGVRVLDLTVVWSGRSPRCCSANSARRSSGSRTPGCSHPSPGGCFPARRESWPNSWARSSDRTRTENLASDPGTGSGFSPPTPGTRSASAWICAKSSGVRPFCVWSRCPTCSSRTTPPRSSKSWTSVGTSCTPGTPT